jgi:sugar/nucleoside kinase (ribokinase family)
MIAVIGDIMLDVLLLPELRRPEQSSGALVRVGGSAANCAAWLAVMGYASTVVGCVGRDPVGSMLRSELNRRGVSMRIAMADGLETGVVAASISDSGERTMRSSRGANEALSPAFIRRLRLAELRIVHVMGYGLLSPYGMDVLHAAAALARRSGAALSFDPSSASAIRTIGADCLLKVTRQENAILTPNAAEAAALTGLDDPEQAARHLSKYAGTVIVKDGPLGAIYTVRGQIRREKAQRVEPLDTTGAGDAFDAGALSALVDGRSLAEACRRGNTLGAAAVQRYGGQP